MKVLEFITRYSKRFLGIGLVAVLTMAQFTVGASTTVQDSIRSRGYITYDPDLDGSPDMAFYSEDLVRIGAGVDSLNDNISELTTKYDELASTSDMYRTNIIDALNTNVYKNSNLPGTTSFLEIISAVQNIPSPTTASGAYYGSGDNNTLGVGISDTNTPVDVPVENVYSLDLGISEQITLPAGYYGDPITIRNGVANRGTISFSPSAKQSITLQAGYYNGGTLDSTSAYNQGYNQGVTDADGRANPSSANYQSGRAQGQADVINNPKGYGISANSNNYSEQTVSMSRSRDEYKNNPTIIVTFSNLTRVDAIVDCRPGAGDGYSPSGSNYFKIPFDRQGLADYLNVDRSALSKELGKMRDEGILTTRKNEFTLHGEST